MPRRYLTFSPGEHFHLYNRGVNRDIIFFDDDNYEFFLHNILRYMLPVVDIVAYCLMPNHYHILIRVKETSEVEPTSEVSRMMMKLAVSYTKGLNHRYDRIGPLFQGAFQAKHISSTAYLFQVIGYIHYNPVEAELVRSPEDWIFSSSRAYLGLEVSQILSVETLLDLGGLANYLEVKNTNLISPQV